MSDGKTMAFPPEMSSDPTTKCAECPHALALHQAPNNWHNGRAGCMACECAESRPSGTSGI